MKLHSYQDEVVWIIGASSGIGEALAKELSLKGATLALSARRKKLLEKLKASLRGPDKKSKQKKSQHEKSQHKIFLLDVTDAKLISQTAKKIHTTFGKIDRVIFLAAAYTPMKLDTLDINTTSEIVKINLLGALYTIHAILPIFKKQMHGQIALCGSVAGYFGLPEGQPYSLTKAGIINLAESLKSESPNFIDVKLISPGFVRTELTDKNNFHMPMIINTEQAAKAITRGLVTGNFEIHFPKRFTIWLKLLRLLPYFLALKIAKTFKK